jgi:hypothetical protein
MPRFAGHSRTTDRPDLCSACAVSLQSPASIVFVTGLTRTPAIIAFAADLNRTPATIALRASFHRSLSIDGGTSRRPNASSPILRPSDALRAATRMLVHAPATVFDAGIDRAPVTFVPRGVGTIAPGRAAATQILAWTVGALSRPLAA